MRSNLLLILLFACIGCRSISDARLDEQRRQLTAAYQDERNPMSARVKAFDDLLETFTPGTREEVIDQYVPYPVCDTKARIAPPEHGDHFQLHMTAPDGSHRWIRLHGDKVER